MKFFEEKASFRDDWGRIFYYDDKIIRAVYSKKFKNILDKNILNKLNQKDLIVETSIINNPKLLDEFQNQYQKKTELLLEHKKIPFISYPFEWNIDQIIDAAIFHLDLELFLLDENFTLRDASAYNIQFFGTKIKFIDILSLNEYSEGQFWQGYEDFKSYFLYPILFQEITKCCFNFYYSGYLRGIDNQIIKNILKYKNYFSFNYILNVILPYYVKKLKNKKILNTKKKNFTKQNYKNQILILKNWIKNISIPYDDSNWIKYENENTYDDFDRQFKKKLVKDFVKKNNINLALDLGCNTGEYSFAMIETGANYVVGCDNDLNCLRKSYQKAKKKNLNFLPIFLDLDNIFLGKGTLENELQSFSKRSNFDGLICLALIHHLCIGKNIPLSKFLNYVIGLSKKGLIEFIPHDDPMVKIILGNKKIIFEDYNLENFLKILSSKATIVKQHKFKNNRYLIQYERID